MTLLPDPPPEPLFCPILSVDDHALEPADLFTSRVSARMRDEVPFMAKDEGDFPVWVIDGTMRVPIALGNGAVGRPPQEWDQGAQKWEDLRPGCYDVRARVRDMDLSGIWAQLCFPSMTWGFAGTRFVKMQDPGVGLACLRAYNDWHLDEWCAAHPDRFVPCQLPWLADPVLAAEEVRRNAERGFRSISFIENPEALGLPSIYSDAWAPFFHACEETGTVINLHVGSSGYIVHPSSEAPGEVLTALFPLQGVLSAVDWIFAKIPVKYPNIKIALSEAGVTWVLMVIERLRRVDRANAEVSKIWFASDPTPSEVFHRNFWFTSIEDPIAFGQLDIIGEDRVMVETDYPHIDSTWPASQAMIRSELAHLPNATVKKLCFENAAQLYRHPSPPAAMIAGSEVGN